MEKSQQKKKMLLPAKKKKFTGLIFICFIAYEIGQNFVLSKLRY